MHFQAITTLESTGKHLSQLVITAVDELVIILSPIMFNLLSGEAGGL